MRELDKEEKNPRYIAFIAVVGIAFLILISKLFTLQVLNAAVYEERALQNRIRTKIISKKYYWLSIDSYGYETIDTKRYGNFESA